MLLRVGETNTIKDVWLGGLEIVWTYPLATLVPSFVIGAIGEVPTYLIDDRRLMDLILSLVTAYLAYYLYLAYAEGIVRRRPGGESSAAAWGHLRRSGRGLKFRSRRNGGGVYRGYRYLGGDLLARGSRGVAVHPLVPNDARDPRRWRRATGRD